MINYSNGLATKEKILEGCKILFCEKGYKKTTFADIRERCEVNPGTIAHHFKNKKNIAATIYNSMIEKFLRYSEELFSERDTLQQNMLSAGMHLKLFYENHAYRRFSSEFSAEGMHSENLDVYKARVTKAYEVTREHVGEQKADFLFIAYKGMDCYIEPYISENIGSLKFENVFTYLMEIYYGFLPLEELGYRTAQALEGLAGLNIEFSCFDMNISFIVS